jgi:hypothetical protein
MDDRGPIFLTDPEGAIWRECQTFRIETRRIHIDLLSIGAIGGLGRRGLQGIGEAGDRLAGHTSELCRLHQFGGIAFNFQRVERWRKIWQRKVLGELVAAAELGFVHADEFANLGAVDVGTAVGDKVNKAVLVRGSSRSNADRQGEGFGIRVGGRTQWEIGQFDRYDLLDDNLAG